MDKWVNKLMNGKVNKQYYELIEWIDGWIGEWHWA